MPGRFKISPANINLSYNQGKVGSEIA